MKGRYVRREPQRLGQLKELERWKIESQMSNLAPVEHNLPELIFESLDRSVEFEFLQRDLKISRGLFQTGLADNADWTYFVQSQNIHNRESGTFNDRTIDFHRYRNQLIKNALQLIFPTFNDINCLDVGCNSGFFSLEFAQMGCRTVSGIDFRSENIAQANFLKMAFGLENVNFRELNVKDLNPSEEQYDIVLNLGLMYHLSTPYEIMKKCYLLTKKVCVIDTIAHKETFSGYHLLIKNSKISIEGDLDFELQPTYRGIIDTIYAAGFSSIIEVRSLNPDGIELYDDESRRCFLAFRDSYSSIESFF